MKPFPIINLEIEGMRHAISVALHDHQLQLDSDMQEALTKYCSPENIKRIINDATRTALDNCIRQEVENFYKFGAGREAVAEAVKNSLLNSVNDI